MATRKQKEKKAIEEWISDSTAILKKRMKKSKDLHRMSALMGNPGVDIAVGPEKWGRGAIIKRAVRRGEEKKELGKDNTVREGGKCGTKERGPRVLVRGGGVVRTTLLSLSM